ncbi:LysR family transcriptional regulator [Sinorhizobium terangae]|uniref:LysR family transcriptional regulator n=1 Tax=Sinorhizobium terangae TaxID=110322 RepID=A0A6N7LBW1_SINTE|nr:LysR family transcriptional regulator [Sinorhizobium terangae]MBB4188312.1 DNA-binding transcriptional LysR family regulator [Sinorhizobium terangae]MQX15337.1 LysR family transcriptional regulator [Sinorhizobium terangae]WFU46682.1 LysR family transcriptional regulator [Sinorhizobium terangae]
MRATDLSELAAFDAVARHRSFRKAAEERGVTASAISHAVSNLEERIGLRLLNRTTRSVSLTDAGTMLLAHLTPAFGEIGSALDALNRFRDTPFGKVRINVPNSIAPFILGRVMGPLIRDNPNLELEISATDRLVDIVEEGFDAGVRLGESLREGMVAVKVGPRLRFAVVGAPDYFRERDIPQTPHELKDHVCVQNMYPTGVRYPWEFERRGEAVAFHPSGPIALDDQELMVQAALSGVALAYVWENRAQREVLDGRLIRCLDEWCPPEDWFYLYYPSRRNISAGLRAVIEAMRV